MFFTDVLEEEKEKVRIIARRQGLKEGREEGMQEKTLDAAKSFYENGVSAEIIAKSLGLTIEHVNEIISTQKSNKI